MTAATLITSKISKRLGGKCKQFGYGVLANNGEFHNDCSTCFAVCGNPSDMGVAERGVLIVSDWRGIGLKWKCPACGIETHEQTTIFRSTKDAEQIMKDALCIRCRSK